MCTRFGEIEFEHCTYDSDADVLYLRNGPSTAAVDFDACPEGHHTRFNAAGKLVGITVVNARLILEEDGVITVTLPDRVLSARDLDAALTAA